LAGYKEKLTLAEFNDYDFIKGFEGYLLYDLKNSRNTVNKSMDFWQTVIKEAKKKGLVQKNAFDDYTKLQAPPPKRVFLEKHELNKLWALRTSDKLKPYQAKVLDYFLFACYSGLRFSDIRKLKYKHFTTQKIPYYDTFRDALIISIQPQKTRKSSGKSMDLPVHDRAKEIAGTGSPEQHVFHTNVSQVNNRYLKEIAEIAGIEKKITFMVSRHTFATIMLNNGTPMEVVAEFSGHTDIKTTQIYAQIVDASKYKYMQQWNDSTK